MFDAALLDSSPRRAPVLTARHWVAALFVGALGFAAGYSVLPLISAPSPKTLIAVSVLVGVGVMFYELMLWYVMADARQLGFSVRTWAAILLVVNFAGFVAYLIYVAAKTGDWKRAALPLAYILEGLLVCILLLVPLIHTQALPNLHWNETLAPPRPPTGPPSGSPHVRATRRTAPQQTLTQPPIIPQHIVMIRDEPIEPQAPGLDRPYVPGAIPGGPGSGHGNFPFGLSTADNVPPPVSVATKPKKPERIYVGGVVEQAKLIYGPKPAYPPLAIVTRTQGTVLLQAIISRDGTIQDLKVVSGPALLINAAVDAVARWRYQPTLLDHEPVEVVTEVEVKFVLNE